MDPIYKKRTAFAGVAGLSTVLAFVGLRGRQVSWLVKGTVLSTGAAIVGLAILKRPPIRVRQTAEEVRREEKISLLGSGVSDKMESRRKRAKKALQVCSELRRGAG